MKNYLYILIAIILFLTACKKQSIESNDYNATKIDTPYIIKQINKLRVNSSMSSLSVNKNLNLSALNHAKYLDELHMSGHNETNTNALNYTGEKPSNRVIYAGYKSTKVSENLSVGQKSEDLSLDGLMSAIYHRFGFLSFSINEIGYAKVNNTYVYNMGNSNINTLCNKNSFNKPGKYIYNICDNSSFRIEKNVYDDAINKVINKNPQYVIYPYKNQTNVTPVFFEEIPDPLPTYQVSGYPISIEFNKNDFNMSNFILNSFILKDSNNDIVNLIEHNNSSDIMSKQNDINNHFNKYQFAIFPEKRLNFNSTYNVNFDYTYEGNNYTINWNFTTKSLNNLIVYNDTTLDISLDKTYFIYLQPIDKNDIYTKISTSCSYSSNGSVKSNVSFYDKNTIKLNISGKEVIQCRFILKNNNGVSKVIIANFN